MKNGDIEYAGKYSAPDYEAIFDADCDLAVESTMIYHTPRSGSGSNGSAFPCSWSAPATRATRSAAWSG